MPDKENIENDEDKDLDESTEDFEDGEKEDLSPEEQLLEFKRDLAQKYIEKISKEDSSVVSMILGSTGILEDYMISEGFGDKLKDKILLKKLLQSSIDKKLIDQIDVIKNKINAVTTQAQLDSLQVEILGNPDQKIVDTQKPVHPTVPNTIKPNEKTDLNSDLFTGLVVGGVLTDNVLQYVRETVKYIEPEIDGDFVNIKEIKDKEGNVIFECVGETPYINKILITDLLGFASAFYKITGKALTLTSGYRTLEHQKRLDEEMPDIAAAPGKSGHNLGFSVDVEETDKNIKTLGGIKGFRKLAEKFNFNPIDSEDWHFDYKKLPEVDSRMQIAQNLNEEFIKNVA